MILSQQLRYCLSKLLQFSIFYIVIVGTTLGLNNLPIDPQIRSFSLRYYWFYETDLYFFQWESFYWYFVIFSALIISKIFLRTPKTLLHKYPIIVIFVIIYLGNALVYLGWPLGNLRIENQLLFIAFCIFPLMCIFFQYIRYQFIYIEKNNYFDVLFGVLFAWPFLSIALTGYYQNTTKVMCLDAVDFTVHNEYSLELFFFYAVPMFFIYPIIFSTEKRKILSILSSGTILIFFMILSNYEFLRFIYEQQFDWWRFISNWWGSMASLIVFVAPLILLPRIFYWFNKKHPLNAKALNLFLKNDSTLAGKIEE